MKIVVQIFILYLSLSVLPGFAQKNPEKYIFRIEIITKHESEVIIQTGFKLKDYKGIITSLHGVVSKIGVLNDDVKIVAVFHDGTELKMKVQSVLPDEDMVLLYNDLLSLKVKTDEGLIVDDPKRLMGAQKLNIKGCLRGKKRNNSNMTLGNDVSVKLAYKIPSDLYRQYEERGSPSVNINVLPLNGEMLKGQSGAPVLTEGNKVVGMMGEQIRGTDYCWAIIISKSKLDFLNSPNNVFVFPKRKIDSTFLEVNADWLTQEQLDSIIQQNHEDSLFVAKIQKKQPEIFKEDHISRFNSGKPGLLSFAYRNNFVVENGGPSAVNTSFYMPSFSAMLALPFAGYRIAAGVDKPFLYQTTSINFYETLTQSNSPVFVNYNLHSIRPFIRISCLSNLVKNRLNPYIGFSYNYIRQNPVQNAWQYSGSNFEGTRQSYTYWIPEETIGIRYACKWYAIELEGSFKKINMKSQNFTFDYFGNAIPVLQTNAVKYYTISLNVVLNCSFIHIYIPKTTRHFTRYEF